MSLTNASRVTAAETISAAAAGTSAGARAVGRVALIGPGGAQVAAELGVIMSKSAVLRTSATLLGRASLPIAVLLTAADVYRAIRARRKADGTDGLEQDPGQPQESVPSVVWTPQHFDGDTPPALDRDAALLADANYHLTGGAFSGPSDVHVSQDGTQAWGTCTRWINGERYDKGCYASSYVGIAKRCPASVDALDPSKSVAAGTYSVGVDGKCPTGRYTVPMTAQEAADARVAAETAAAVDYPALLREAAMLGPVTVPDDAVQQLQPGTVTPARISGPVTTTVAADGTSVTEETDWDFAGLADNAAPFPGATMPTARATWKESTTTTTKAADGTTTGTTTKTTQPTVDPSTAVTGPTDPNDPCASHPDRVGCLVVGDMPTGDVPKKTVPLTWSQEDVGIGSGGACPAPRTVLTYVISYQPACDAAVAIRPFVLVAASIAALLLVMSTIRGAA